jgi:hypothetical protein
VTLPDRYRRHGAGAALAILVAAIPASPASAQARDLTDPGAAQLRRELRSLDNRIDTRPRGGGLQLDRARRELIRQGRGVAFTPEQARIDRELDRLEGELRRSEEEPRPEPTSPPRSELPRSYDAPTTSPGGSNNLVTATRLLNRAERALAAGRVVQAQSDLAAARGFLGRVRPQPPVAERREELADRLQRLEEQAAGAAGR